MELRKAFSIGLACVLGILLFPIVTMMFENLDASQIMVIQAPISGEMTWHTTPGLKYQGFGKVTDYQRRSQFWFSASPDQGKKTNESLKITFNDGGHAKISGSLSWELPLDAEHLTTLHQKFGSHHAIEQQLIRTAVEKSIYMTGPLMSSTESYASRKNELLHLIEDQINNGIYQTRTVTEVQKDPITNTERKVSVVQLILDKDSKPLRSVESPLQEFKIRTFNLAINKVDYDEKVEAQIQQQQQAIMQVQIAIAEGKKAEQQAITTAKQGEAKAADEEWKQKAIAAKETAKADMDKKVAETVAQQKLEVAKLNRQEAEEFKKAEILRGEGEATKRKLVMEADGALEKKLDALVKINESYASAIGKHQGQWVPNVVMGQQGQGSSNSAQALIDLFMVKTARDLGVDISTTNSPTLKKN